MEGQDIGQPSDDMPRGNPQSISKIRADHDPKKEDKAHRQGGPVQRLCQPVLHADAPKNFCIMGYIS